MSSYGSVDSNNILIVPDTSFNRNDFMLVDYGDVRLQYTPPTVSYNSSTKILTVNSPKIQCWGTNSAGSSFGKSSTVYLACKVYLT